MIDKRPTWILVREAAQRLSSERNAPFKLAILIAEVQRTDPSRQRETIQPVVQGMTANAGKGPLSPCGKILERVDHGYYRLLIAPSGGPSLVPDSPPTATTSGSRTGYVGRRARTVGRKELEARIVDLVANFSSCVDAYDRDVPFARSGQYEFHRETIALRRALGSATAAIADGRFTLLLHATLQKWGIGRRASRLVPLDVFRAQLREYAAHIADLQEASLERGPIDAGTIERIDHLVRTLTVVENKAKIVACTKTLHHLLPDLVPPMDRAWTGAFFGWSTVDPQNNQREILDETLHAFARIARETRPSQFVGKGWRTSLTKVLDNALIGYCMIKGIGGATA